MNIFLGPPLSVSLLPQWARADPASPGGLPIPLGGSLDLLWALWGQLIPWPGPILTCICPLSSLLGRLHWTQLWGHLLSMQVFHRCRIYQANLGDLIQGLCSCTERVPFLFLSRTTPGAQLWFWPHLCMCATLRHLFPAQVRGSESSRCLGHTCSLRPGCARVACSGGGRQAVVTNCGGSLWWESLPVAMEAGAGV